MDGDSCRTVTSAVRGASVLVQLAASAPGRGELGAGNPFLWLIGSGRFALWNRRREPHLGGRRSVDGRAVVGAHPSERRDGQLALHPGSGRDDLGAGTDTPDRCLCRHPRQLFGVVLSQVGRLYMGRSFGLLPANRGVITTGPFRLVRHPIYLGWFILTVGYVMAYPNALNALAVICTLPFMMWRIDLEEKLLCDDPSYRAYAERVRYRLIPWLF